MRLIISMRQKNGACDKKTLSMQSNELNFKFRNLKVLNTEISIYPTNQIIGWLRRRLSLLA